MDQATFDAQRPAILKVIGSFADAWNRHDGTLLAPLYAPDADFVNVMGQWLRGRDEIVETHDAAFRTVMRPTRLTFGVVEVRPLGSEAAVAHAPWTLEGEPSGERRGMITAFLLPSGPEGGWEIHASQNTGSGAPPDGGGNR